MIISTCGNKEKKTSRVKITDYIYNYVEIEYGENQRGTFSSNEGALIDGKLFNPSSTPGIATIAIHGSMGGMGASYSKDELTMLRSLLLSTCDVCSTREKSFAINQFLCGRFNLTVECINRILSCWDEALEEARKIDRAKGT